MMRLLLVILSLFLPSFAVIGAQGEQQDTPQALPHSFSHSPYRSYPQSLPQLKQRLEWFLASEKIPGAQIALFDRKGVYWQLALGQRDKGKGLPVEAETLFRAGSTTKTLVALAIMQLAGQGKLSLQDEVHKLAPEVAIENPWRETHPVRVVHLLEHSAGLDDMHFRNIYNLSDPGIPLLDAVNRDARALKVRWPPGTRHAYSNPGYGVLGYIIEKLSGRRFEHYIGQQIMLPAGMSHSSMELTPALAGNLSRGHSDKAAVVYQDIYLRSAGSLHTTAYELAQLGRLLLTRDREDLLPGIGDADILRMEQPGTTLAARAGLSYGYGLGIYAASQSQRAWLGHGGAIAGFLASYGYSPAIGQGYALVLNSDSAHIHPLLELITGYLAKEHPLDEPADIGGVDADINGYYRMANDRNEIFAGIAYPLNAIAIEAKDSEITVKPVIGEGGAMYHVGGQQFREADNSHASAIFIRHPENGKVFELNGQYYVQSSRLAAWGIVIGLTLALMLVVLTLLYLPVWLVGGARGKLAGKGRLGLRLYPAAASLSLCIVVTALFSLPPQEVGQLNWQSLFICVFSLVFALCSLLAFWQLVKMWRLEPHLGVRYFSLLSVTALVMLTVYGWHFNYIGLSLWSW